MSDDIDRAQAREEEMRSDALADRDRRAHGHAPRVSATTCLHCDTPIPEGRRLAVPGVQTCVECQTDIERQGRADWGMLE